MQRFLQQLGGFVLQVCPNWQPAVRAGTSRCPFAVNVCFMHLPCWDRAGKVRSVAQNPRVLRFREPSRRWSDTQVSPNTLIVLQST